MEIEQTVRAACALREPAPDFEDVVMARVSAAAWRASRGPVRVRRVLLISALIASVAAAAIVTTRYSGSASVTTAPLSRETAAVAPPIVESAMPLAVDSSTANGGAEAAVVPQVPPAPPVPPTAADVSQVCAAAQPGPSIAPAYTVLLEPLQFETDDPELASRVQRFYSAATNQLKSVPGLALVGSEAAGTAGKPADYRVTVAIGKNADTRAGQPAWQATATLQPWTGTSFGNGNSRHSAIPSLDASICPSTPTGAPTGQDFNCRLEQAGAGMLLNLSASLPRAPAQAACETSRVQLFRAQIAQQITAEPARFFPTVRQTLERLATTTNPITRSNAWASLARNARPEYAQLLVHALQESTDDAFRSEVVTLLAVKYPDAAAVREALAAMAARSPDTLMRHVAERPTAAQEVWRDYAISRLSDDRLPTEQRLDALFWMTEAMMLDKDRIAAEMSALLTVLQRNRRLPVLADILAGTLKNLGEAGPGPSGQPRQWTVGQLGQLTLRQIGSVHHPAVADLLIACFDAAPNDMTLEVLATRRDDPRVASKLESIANLGSDERLRRSATRLLSRPLEDRSQAPPGN
jgi:hypothetical protein